MARDYRSIKRYDISKIYHDKLESKEWIGKRLSFLWDMREHYIDDYLSNELELEKEEIYRINDNLVSSIADRDYNSINPSLYTNINIRQEYRRLEYLKLNNREEFLLKKNVNMYMYITSNYESYEYEYEDEY